MQKTEKKNDERTMAWLYLNFQLETIDTNMSLWKISPKTPHRFTTHTKTTDEVGGGGGTH